MILSNNNDLPPLLAVGQRRRGLVHLILVTVGILLLAAVATVAILYAVKTSAAPPVSTAPAAPTTVATEPATTPSSAAGAITTTSTTTKPPVKKVIALTFDDGPSSYTQQIAQILKEKGATATFFCIGRQIKQYEEVVTQLKADGFQVENHTWDHKDLTKLNLKQLRSQISRTSQALGGAKYIRPPFGHVNASVLAEIHRLGLQIVLWNVDTRDWKNPDVNAILALIRQKAQPGAIILMHDGGGNRSQTVAVLPQVIDWLRAQGYAFVRVDELGAQAHQGTIK